MLCYQAKIHSKATCYMLKTTSSNPLHISCNDIPTHCLSAMVDYKAFGTLKLLPVTFRNPKLLDRHNLVTMHLPSLHIIVTKSCKTKEVHYDFEHYSPSDKTKMNNITSHIWIKAFTLSAPIIRILALCNLQPSTVILYYITCRNSITHLKNTRRCWTKL